jgi:hypothetical protein
VLLGLLTCTAVLHFIRSERVPFACLGRGVLALVLGCLLVFAADFAIAKRLTWTPGGFALSFGRMLQDGIVKKYLDEHCPAPALWLCAYKNALPNDADAWFWGSALFDRLGRFAGLGPEMAKIVVESVIDYPALQIETAAIAMAKQLIDVHTGEGVLPIITHTYRIIERYTPQLAPAMHAARQQKGELSFTAINALHYPLALVAMALLPVLIWLAWRGALPASIGELAATVTLALLGNAFVCGALANPHNRYGARMVWLASLTVILAIVGWCMDRLGRPDKLA